MKTNSNSTAFNLHFSTPQFSGYKSLPLNHTIRLIKAINSVIPPTIKPAFSFLSFGFKPSNWLSNHMAIIAYSTTSFKNFINTVFTGDGLHFVVWPSPYLFNNGLKLKDFLEVTSYLSTIKSLVGI